MNLPDGGDVVFTLVCVSLALGYVLVRELIARAMWRRGFDKHTPKITYRKD